MKIGIVGAGLVGSCAAFAMVMRGVASEIVLIDRNEKLAHAQAQDILHGTPFAAPTRIWAGSYADLSGARVVILSAGVSQEPGESRLHLLERNAKVFGAIIPSVLAHAPDAILLVTSNPVDVMTDIARRISGLPAERVIGSGTVLDTARFRSLLGEHVGVSPKSVHAYVLGEHGDSEVLWWSGANVGNVGVQAMAEQLGRPIDAAARGRIDEAVRKAAYRIIDGKGATWFGIGSGLTRIVQAILSDENALLSISALPAACEGIPAVPLSVPRLVGAAGAGAPLIPVLDPDEKVLLQRSAEILKEASDSVHI
ncbi:MAG: L-lactate dehydrogenase [Telmatospirillum sp.]|nr:L-lactate dehydrogenase [Telmatospirillum sp.]